jgi:EAL domain-containing protein (putative c-di-GMP-specific phosphodiesterase class I)
VVAPWLAIVHVEGLSEIGKLMDSSVAEQAVATALRSSIESAEPEGSIPWFVGHFADDEVAIVVASAQREAVETRVAEICARLSDPISIGGAVFKLRPCAGVAILGQDAATEQALIEHARAAAAEAQRAEGGAVSFFSDTIKLRSLTRIDVALELQEAILNGEIGLRYRGRHDLASGRLVALVGYMRWIHPMRGVLPPSQFLPIAAATGLSTALSRSLLETLQQDFWLLQSHLKPGVRISYGALRHHVLDNLFFKDVGAMIHSQNMPPESLEVRISERSYVAKESREWLSLADQGVQVVVDEVGRRLSSIDRLARAPITGLQLDRKCAAASETDEAADRVGQAVLGVAKALGLTPITTAVDSERQRKVLLAQGWTQGSGDLFCSVVGVAAAVPDLSART